MRGEAPDDEENYNVDFLKKQHSLDDEAELISRPREQYMSGLDPLLSDLNEGGDQDPSGWGALGDVSQRSDQAWACGAVAPEGEHSAGGNVLMQEERQERIQVQRGPHLCALSSDAFAAISLVQL